MSIKSSGKNTDEQFLEKVKQNLNVRTENLDEKILYRLNKMRYQALHEEKEKKRKMFPAFRWVRAGALSTLGVAIALMLIWVHSHHPTLLFKNPEDFEIVSSQDQMELYEDLDFYKWLAASDSRG